MRPQNASLTPPRGVSPVAKLKTGRRPPSASVHVSSWLEAFARYGMVLPDPLVDCPPTEPDVLALVPDVPVSVPDVLVSVPDVRDPDPLLPEFGVEPPPWS